MIEQKIVIVVPFGPGLVKLAGGAYGEASPGTRKTCQHAVPR